MERSQQRGELPRETLLVDLAGLIQGGAFNPGPHRPQAGVARERLAEVKWARHLDRQLVRQEQRVLRFGLQPGPGSGVCHWDERNPRQEPLTHAEGSNDGACRLHSPYRQTAQFRDLGPKCGSDLRERQLDLSIVHPHNAHPAGA
jgi:hypothetical protein